jgi:hypothetical protein
VGPWKAQRRSWARRSRSARRRARELGRRLAEQPAGDDQQLDLLGALEDVEDLGVAGPLLEQLGLAVADRAAQLDAAQRDVDAVRPALALAIEASSELGLPVVGHPRRLQGQQPGRLVVGLHGEQLAAAACCDVWAGRS